MGTWREVGRLRVGWATLGWALCVWGVGTAHADEVQVAVAANFAVPFQRLAADFAASTGHRAVGAVGSTAKLATQIQQGAPFEVLLAADDETPKRLMSEGLAVKGQSFTYAIGKLVLWSPRPAWVDAEGAVLRKGDFARLAIANPKLAPYGAAAMEVLKALGLQPSLSTKIVQGENIAQAHQFVATGNAELGFVAMSQVALPGAPVQGSMWVVPAALYPPILQDAVLLNKGANSAAAKAWLAYLRGDAARAVIKSYGYGF